MEASGEYHQNRCNTFHQTPPPTSTDIALSSHRHHLEPSHQIPGPRIGFQTPFYETPEHRHTQGHGRFACTFSPPCQRFYVGFGTTNSLSTNY